MQDNFHKRLLECGSCFFLTFVNVPKFLELFLYRVRYPIEGMPYYPDVSFLYSRGSSPRCTELTAIMPSEWSALTKNPAFKGPYWLYTPFKGPYWRYIPGQCSGPSKILPHNCPKWQRKNMNEGVTLKVKPQGKGIPKIRGLGPGDSQSV